MKTLKDRRGKYGLAKFRAFAVLEGREWVSSRELVLLAGLSYHSISRLLPKWVRYEYVERRLAYRWGVGSYEYRLRSRGYGWIEAARRDLPMAGWFAAGLRSWQRSIEPHMERLLAGPFKDVVAVLSRDNGGFSSVSVDTFLDT